MSVCMCVNTCPLVPLCMCGAQRIFFNQESLFPSIMGILGVKLRSSGLYGESLYTVKQCKNVSIWNVNSEEQYVVNV